MSTQDALVNVLPINARYASAIVSLVSNVDEAAIQKQKQIHQQSQSFCKHAIKLRYLQATFLTPNALLHQGVGDTGIYARAHGLYNIGTICVVTYGGLRFLR